MKQETGQSQQVSVALRALMAMSLALGVAAGCIPVRPEQRGILSDPMMRFDQSGRDGRAKAQVLENREGSLGGGTVQGGGCGCN